MRLTLCILLTALCVSSAQAACYEDTIDTVSEDGDLIVLTSGLAFDVLGGDDVTAALWTEGDDVLICGSTMINKDENGEKVEVTPH
jgi:hypothetical protein